MKSKASASRIETLRPSRNVPSVVRRGPSAEGERGVASALGVLVGLGPKGEAWVDVPQLGRKNVPARSTVALAPEQVGREVLIACIAASGELVISGVIRQAAADNAADRPAPRLEAELDAERIVFTAQREVVLRCGKASILLSADGSVVIKGAKLLASATGVHRIRGGAVQIN